MEIQWDYVNVQAAAPVSAHRLASCIQTAPCLYGLVNDASLESGSNCTLRTMQVHHYYFSLTCITLPVSAAGSGIALVWGMPSWYTLGPWISEEGQRLSMPTTTPGSQSNWARLRWAWAPSLSLWIIRTERVNSSPDCQHLVAVMRYSHLQCLCIGWKGCHISIRIRIRIR